MPHCPSTPRPLFLAIALSLGTLAQVVMPTAVVASEAQRQAFDIPAGPLARQLTQLAAQTGLLLAADAELTRDRQSQAVRGSYSAEEALDLMLAGSGLMAERKDGRYQLMPVPAPQAGGTVELGATAIMGQGMGQATENTGSYTPGLVSAGSKTPTSLKETPQSVSVLTRQYMDDRQIADINDAMKTVPGITVQSGTFRI